MRRGYPDSWNERGPRGASSMGGHVLGNARLPSGGWIAVAMWLWLVLSPAGEGVAEIYTWVDRDGQVHFTDDPSLIPAEYRDRVQTRPSSPPSEIASRPTASAKSTRDKRAKTASPSRSSTGGLAKVVAVIDGDTIVLSGGEKVRYGGLSTISPRGILPSIFKGCP